MPVDISSQAKIESGTFFSSMGDETHIFYRHYLPLKNSNPKLHIIFQHGLIEYQKRHEELFTALFEAFDNNIMISAMDLVGHGKSGGQRAHIDQFKVFEKDFVKFLEICHQRTDNMEGIDHFVISHSLGGLIVLSTLNNESYVISLPLKSLIFVNPCISAKLKLSEKLIKFLSNVPDALRQIRIPMVYDAYDLTHDNEKAIEFRRDPLISKAITLKMASEIYAATQNITRHSYFFKFDSLFILSGDDRLVDNDKSRLFITGMDKKFARTVEYPNMCHDILNETCRNEVFQEIINHIKSKENC